MFPIMFVHRTDVKLEILCKKAEKTIECDYLHILLAHHIWGTNHTAVFS
jgi:hypothetical protein